MRTQRRSWSTTRGERKMTSDEIADSEWTFELASYLWAVGVNSDVGIGPINTEDVQQTGKAIDGPWLIIG